MIFDHRTRSFIRTCIPLLLALVLATPVLAQGEQPEEGRRHPLRFGLFGHVALNDHVADFQGIPGTQSCCVGFDGGTGGGIAGGALLEVPLANWLLIGGRASFLTQPFSMTTSEETFVIVNGVGTAGAFEHRLDGSIATIGIEPMLGFRPFGGALVYLGARAGFPISSSYEQWEQLSQPTGTGTFMASDGTDSRRRTRNEFSGALPDPLMQITPMIGASYELPMNSSGSLLLAPEVFYQHGFTNVHSDVDWKIHTLRLGVALKYGPSPKPDHIAVASRDVVAVAEMPVEIEEPVEETPAVSAPRLSAAVNAVSVETDGSEKPMVRLTVEEFSSTLMTPLLPYIFFEEGSDVIPDRYSDIAGPAVESFNIDAENSPDRLPTYHHLLNIVGRRLRDNPTAKVTLTGCNQDIRDEKGDVALSRRRAEAVRKYLIDVWKIADDRITLEARNLPAKAANTTTADGSQENRRVEIASSDLRILAPVITNDTLRRSNPPAIRFRPQTVAEAGVASWSLTASQDGKMLKRVEGTDAVPTVIDWNVNRESSSIPRREGTIAYKLAVTDATGAGAESESAIPVELVTIRKKRTERRGDIEIDRFSLILFDVRSSELLPSHKPIIDLIDDHVGPNSEVFVTGYTDRLGDEAYNQQLAESRASTVVRALGSGTTDTKGIGEADLFDSTLPEGRLYTRTVDVIIETPVKE